MPEIKQGDWVVQAGVYRPLFGTVRTVWPDGTIDIVAYGPTGTRFGRLSPPEGGPTNFEPCCPAKNYRVIHEPAFPLKLDLRGDWSGSLKFVTG